MRESGFTEIRWYHGQIVRPKLIFSYWLGAFFMLRKYLYLGNCETHKNLN